MVELEPVSSWVVLTQNLRRRGRGVKLDVAEDGFCNVMCDVDQQQEDQFFECNGIDESDVNTILT